MEVELLAKERNLFGSQSVKHLRHQGEIPAVLYGKKMKNMHIQVKNENLVKILHTSAGENAIIKLNIEKDSSSGEQKKNKMVNVLIKEIQYDPITMAILHIDFSPIIAILASWRLFPIKQKHLFFLRRSFWSYRWLSPCRFFASGVISAWAIGSCFARWPPSR